MPSISVEILSRPKGKDTSNDALPKFLAQYASAQRVGSLIKETPSGKLMSEWQTVVNESSSKPQLVDMAPAISALMGIKDEEEIVGLSISSAVIRTNMCTNLEMDPNRSQLDLHFTQTPCSSKIGINFGQGVENHARRACNSDRNSTGLWRRKFCQRA